MVRLGVKDAGGGLGLGDGLRQKCRAEVRRHSSKWSGAALHGRRSRP
jgi:hypothetical protein